MLHVDCIFSTADFRSVIDASVMRQLYRRHLSVCQQNIFSLLIHFHKHFPLWIISTTKLYLIIISYLQKSGFIFFNMDGATQIELVCLMVHSRGGVGLYLFLFVCLFVCLFVFFLLGSMRVQALNNTWLTTDFLVFGAHLPYSLAVKQKE